MMSCSLILIFDPFSFNLLNFIISPSDAEYVLAIFLIVFWNRGIFLGVIFILGGITYIVLLLKTIVTNTPHQWYMLFWGMVLAVPAFVVGILFILDWKRRKKNG